MQTFSRKPRTNQQRTSIKSTMLGRTHFERRGPVHLIHQLQSSIGNQALQRLRQSNAVMRMPAPCEKNLQRQAGLGSPGPGRSLPVSTRRFFEPRFGYNFGNVRVHTNAEAARTAASIQAKAYTIGNNIVFAANEYQPSTLQGQRVLAHELTHVIQQNTGISTPLVQRLADPDCDSASGLPFSDSCVFTNTCYSSSFTAPGGTTVTVNVTVNYDDPGECSFPPAREDFRVRLKQCGWVDTEVQNFGTSNIGRTLTGTATLPGAGIFIGNDNYYLRVNSRSACRLTASMTVT